MKAEGGSLLKSLYGDMYKALRYAKVDGTFLGYFARTFGYCLLYFLIVQFIHSLVYCFSEIAVDNGGHVKELASFLHFNPESTHVLKFLYIFLLVLPLLLLRKTSRKEFFTAAKVTVREQGLQYIFYLGFLYVACQNIMVAGDWYINVFGLDVWFSPSGTSLLALVYANELGGTFISWMFFVFAPFLCLIGWNLREERREL